MFAPGMTINQRYLLEEEIGREGCEAQALCDWAAGLQKRVEPDDLAKARQLLEQALAIHIQCQVEPLAEQVRGRLRDLPW